MIYLFYDTETTGKWHRDLAIDHEAQPSLVQLAALLCDGRQALSEISLIVRPDGWVVPNEVSQIHGISDYRARSQGVPLITALAVFSALCANADVVVGHNLAFDVNIIMRSYWQIGRKDRLPGHKICTMLMATDVLKLPKPFQSKKKNDQYKWPNLQESYEHFFGESFSNAHTANADVAATAAIYWAMKDQGVEDIKPKIMFKPFTRPSKNSNGNADEHRTFANLQAIMNQAKDLQLNEWEAKFVADMLARIEQYQDHVLVSPNQWAIVEKLGAKCNKKGDAAE